VIFEKDEVVKDNGEPYTIFTPYSRKWKATLDTFYQKSYATTRYLKALKKTKPLAMPSLEDLGFQLSDGNFPERTIKQSIITNYHKQRDCPSIHGTTKLSAHLRFGTVSIRKLVQIAKKKNETWLNELIWRDFYHMILWHFPHVVTQSFKPAYDRIRLRNNEKEFEAWCEGRTGYPIVDAGMRELNETGFMHNRVRMIVASFLTKHLLIDWRWGEAYFAKKLLDYDLAANNGGWQWAAGSGCDAAPYFRVFNPELQTQRFDPDHNYIKKWVPEFESNEYPEPLVDHKFARDRFLKAYKAALNEHS
jgi:deoxyribodipyrimidine photo-lyase